MNRFVQFLISEQAGGTGSRRLALGWLTAALSCVGATLGLRPAFADACGGLPPGQCALFCTTVPCGEEVYCMDYRCRGYEGKCYDERTCVECEACG